MTVSENDARNWPDKYRHILPTWLSDGLNARLVLALLVAATTIAALVHGLDIASRLSQNSDSVQSFLAGKVIADGNIFLSGWRLSIDNFYFTDALPYAVLERVLGPRPYLMVLVPAFTYALFVFTVLLTCLDRERPIARNLDAIAVIAFLLASPVWIGDWDPLLLSAAHAATVVGSLLALWLCSWISGTEESSTLRLLGAGSGLVMISAATLASDPLSLVFAFGPGLVLLAFETCRRRGNVRLALALLAGGTVLGLLLPFIIGWGGGFVAVNANTLGITASKFGSNLLAMLLGALTLFGANPLLYQGGIGAVIFLIFRAIAFGLVACVAGYVLAHMFGKRQVPLFDRLLLAGALTLLCACAVSTKFGTEYTSQSITDGGPTIRYVLVIVLICAVLTGRRISAILDGVSDQRARTVVRGALLCFAALAVFAGDWRGAVVEPPKGWLENSSAAEVAHWLVKRRLQQGAGDYWSANLITAISGDTVRIRSVASFKRRLIPYNWIEDVHANNRRAQFILWREPNPMGVVTAQVRATYPVCKITVVASYHVAVLDTRVQGRPSQCRDIHD